MRLREAEFAKYRALAMGGANFLKHRGVIDGKAPIEYDARNTHRRHQIDQFLRGQGGYNIGPQHADQTRVNPHHINIVDQRPKRRDSSIAEIVYTHAATDPPPVLHRIADCIIGHITMCRRQ